jgi:cytochrome c-type biogenesis protein CcmH/NrfG
MREDFMKNAAKPLLILAALLVSVAPLASPVSASPNWLSKHLPHHVAKTPLHPQHDPDKAAKQRQKAISRAAKMRQRAADAHPVPTCK